MVISVLLSITVPHVASNTFHILTSQDQPCPGQFTGDPCITLQQYARGEHITDPDAPLPSNVILDLQPGIHSLSSVLTSSNMDSFEMRGENATIRCTVLSNSLPFTFQRIQSFQISNINFTGCLPLVLSQITNSSIVNTSFFNMLGRCLVVQSSSVLLKRSTFIGNSVRLKQSYFTREPIQNCRGGAVDSQQSTISVEQCSFRYNRATCRISRRPYRDTVAGWGGAIATRQNTTITIVNSTFIRNSAGEHGGAVYVDGGSISVENSSFLFNSVGLLRAQVGYRLREESGGAISVNDINSNSVTINQSNFINNTAATGGGFFISVDRDTPQELDISIAESSFVNNGASSNRGGGIMYISTDRTRISLHQSSFINNTAGGSGGGGMYVSGNRPRINVYHSNFTNNTAGGTGGGGGMYVSGDHTLISVHQSNFTNNSVVERGTVGGALKVSGQNSSITILQSSFINNTASQLQGGEGGALNTNGHNTRILFTESIFADNSAFACAVLNAEGSDLNVAFTGSVFTYNKVSEISTQSDADIQANSGGVACVNSASVSITNSSFRNNAASRHAGVLNVEGSTVSIKRSNFHNNQAGHDGGVIFTRVSPITLSVTQSSFTNNWAGGNGGVMNVARSGSRLDINDSNFSFNEASQRGGALAIAGSELNINQTAIYNNMAALGGVISACNSVVTVSEALTFSEDPGNNFQCTFYDGNTTATDTSTTVGPTVPRVASNRFHIITSQDQPCPGQFTGDPCITLQQYARGEHITDPDAPLPNNVILDLQPGIHSLSSVLTSSNMDSFEMRGENATIRCTVFSNSLPFTFQRIQSFQISNIDFTGCLPLVLSQITNSSIVNTSFFNMLGRCLVVQSSSVLLKRSTFIGNSVRLKQSYFTREPIQNCRGGAVDSQQSTISVEQCSFRYNRATCRISRRPYRDTVAGWGGAIATRQNTTITIVNSTFIRNSAGEHGGAVYVDGGSISVENSSFLFNSVGLLRAQVGYRLREESGGAISVNDINSNSVTINQSNFINNTAATGGGFFISVDRDTPQELDISIAESSFVNNGASSNRGGGIMYISTDRTRISLHQSSFINNTAGGSGGGGMYVSGDHPRINVYHSNFTNNTAGGTGGGGGGGGMYVSGDHPRINVYHSNFTNNTAGGTGGGGGGGGMYVSGDHTLISVHQSNFANNSVVERGTVGGALKVSGQNSSITILQSSFINNTASQLQGGEGGALNTNGHNTRILFTESIFANNSAFACAVLNAEGSDLNVAFTGSVFTYNKVSEISTQSDADIQANSGGVACVNSASLSITNSSFRNNAASRHAGVLNVEGSTVSIKGSNFHNNQAGHDGGVIFTRVSPITLSVTQSSFTNNWVGGNGGVMNVARSGSRLDINDSNFSFNEASQRGGALAIAGSELNINQTAIYNNMAALGGVISACNSVVTVSEALTFSEDPGNNFQCTFYDGNTTATDTSTTVGPTVPRVASNRFHIITSQDQPCPGQFTGDPCITLQQYARGEHITDPDAPLPNNVILDLQPGIHSLSSVLTSSNMDSFEMRGENATIRCTVFSNSLPFTFQRIQSFQISNIDFTGCLPLVLSQITNSSIVNTSFFNMLGRCLVVQSSSVLLKRSTFIGNSVRLKQSYFTREPIQNCRGGAVDSQQSTISVEQCSFRYNRATCRISRRPYRDTVAGWGGAIATRQNTTITIANSMFIRNSAGEHGGAVYVDGGSISVENSSFLFNSVGLLRAQVGYRLREESGGAISVNDINSNSVTINQSNFINNTAATGGGFFISVDRDTPQELDISIAESSFVNNGASSNRGGGIMYISTDRTRISLHQSSFINNTAGGSGGGGMYVSGDHPRINVYHSNFTNNTAGGTGGGGGGGGMYVSGDHPRINVYHSNFTNNTAGGTGGGGGGMYVLGDHTLISVHQSNFANNSVVERGTVGGALKVSGQNSSITILQSSFINNRASQLQGGEGGALNTNGHNTRILFTESIFANNSAFACAVLNAEGSDLNVAFTGSVFTYNKVSEISTQSDADIQANSGGVACVNSASLSITNSSFRNNAASRHAGVLNVEGSTVSIKGSNFHNNQAGHDGGVIFTRVSPITLSVTQSSFTNNWAGVNGGVMNVVRSGSRLDINDSNFSFNEASQRGGTLAIAGSELNINQTTVYNNMAALGGVISACNSVVTVSEALTFSEDPGNNFQCTFYDGNTTATDTSTTVGPTVPRVASNRFHIITSQDQPCPGQFTGDPCITLQQYARGEHITDPDAPLPNNVILDLQPGIHSLSSVLTSSNMDSFEMRGENATIRCTVFSNSLPFTFQRIQSFQISNIDFTGCLPLVLSQITNSSIVNTSFFNMLGRCLVVQSSSVLLKRSTFIGNSVRLKQSYFTREPIQNCRGGAVDSQQSTISVEQCSFRYNRATCRISRRPYRDTVAGWGGAIATRQNTTITIANSMFIRNSAGEHGGAVYVDGGSISVENSSFLFNSVGLLRAQVGYRLREESGGAISVNDINSNSVTINQSNFINNTAATGGGFFISVDRDTPQELDISIAESSFVNNGASSNRGGGIMYISTDRTRISLHQSSFINNTAGGSGGGGMYVSGDHPRINVYHSNFTNNTAGGTGGGGGGGGMYVSGDHPRINVYHSNFTNNTAGGTGGGGGGGGMYVSGDHTLISVHQSNFANNSVVERGTVGGALKVSGQNSSITILQSSFINNTASQLQGGEGGALNTNGHNTRILFTESIFANNSAFACAVLNAEGSDLNVAFTGSVFTYNKVSEISTQSDADIQANSGGVACVNSASLSITNSSFRNNAASRHAGVLNVEGSTVSIKGSNFHNNQAGHDGGVIFTRVSPITLSVTQSSFTNNWAGGNGGVMNVARSGSRLDINDSNFSFNEASQRGGALAIAGSELNINQTAFYNNMAALGGVISACNSVVTVSEALTFSEDPGNNFQCTFYDGNTTATDTSTTVGPTVPRVASNRFHIITSQDQPCPGQFTGDPCITLQQYARGEHITDPDAPLPNNVILDLQPGIHSLSSVLTSSNMDSFEMRGENATIRCTVLSNSLPFTFQRIQSFQISNINFTGCLPLVLSQITNSSIVNTSFFNMLGRCLVVQSSSVLLKRSTFIGNSVRLKQSYFTHEPIQNCRGGAVDSQQSTISVEQCSFRYNRATCRISRRPYRDTVAGWGGAIATRQNTTITIANSTFIRNSAGEHGGAVYVDGGSISVENSSFLFNSVGLLRAQVGYRLREESGGAISVNDINSNSVTINQSNFINNTAATGGGFFISVDRDTPQELDISIVESSFVNNGASSNRGGGIMYISTDRTRISLHQSSFINNTAGGSGGGGMYVSGDHPRINVYHSNFTNNTAGGTGGGGGGGGMYVSGDHPRINVYHSNFTNNTAGGTGGGGGGMYVLGDHTLISVHQSNFANNSVVERGTVGGALKVSGQNSSITILQSSFINNRASQLQGGEGGALNTNGHNTRILFTESIFANNSAFACAVLNAEGSDLNVAFTGSVFTYNKVSEISTQSDADIQANSGGVACVNSASVSITNSSFRNNAASRHAGVLNVEGSTVSIKGSNFHNNQAGHDGGVIFTGVSPITLSVTQSSFTNNWAGGNGGVMNVARSGSRLDITDSNFSFNEASQRGGVLAIAGSELNINQTTVYNNMAALGGVISACNYSVVTVSEALTFSEDPGINFECSLYNGNICDICTRTSTAVEVSATTVIPNPSTTITTTSSEMSTHILGPTPSTTISIPTKATTISTTHISTIAGIADDITPTSTAEEANAMTVMTTSLTIVFNSRSTHILNPTPNPTTEVNLLTTPSTMTTTIPQTHVSTNAGPVTDTIPTTTAGETTTTTVITSPVTTLTKAATTIPPAQISTSSGPATATTEQITSTTTTESRMPTRLSTDPPLDSITSQESTTFSSTTDAMTTNPSADTSTIVTDGTNLDNQNGNIMASPTSSGNINGAIINVSLVISTVICILVG